MQRTHSYCHIVIAFNASHEFISKNFLCMEFPVEIILWEILWKSFDAGKNVSYFQNIFVDISALLVVWEITLKYLVLEYHWQQVNNTSGKVLVLPSRAKPLPDQILTQNISVI